MCLRATNSKCSGWPKGLKGIASPNTWVKCGVLSTGAGVVISIQDIRPLASIFVASLLGLWKNRLILFLEVSMFHLRVLAVILSLCVMSCAKQQAPKTTCFRMNLGEDPATLDPRKARDINAV